SPPNSSSSASSSTPSTPGPSTRGTWTRTPPTVPSRASTTGSRPPRSDASAGHRTPPSSSAGSRHPPAVGSSARYSPATAASAWANRRPRSEARAVVSPNRDGRRTDAQGHLLHGHDARWIPHRPRRRLRLVRAQRGGIPSLDRRDQERRGASHGAAALRDDALLGRSGQGVRRARAGMDGAVEPAAKARLLTHPQL